jgi:hypothetical protein
MGERAGNIASHRKLKVLPGLRLTEHAVKLKKNGQRFEVINKGAVLSWPYARRRSSVREDANSRQNLPLKLCF